MEELKPCPFCGGEVRISYGGDSVYMWYAISGENFFAKNHCKCNVTMCGEFFRIDAPENEKNEEKTALIRRWNSRVNDATQE